MYTRNGDENTNEWQLWHLKTVQIGLVAVGTLLFVIGMAYSLGAGGVVDPGISSFGDDSDDERSSDERGDDSAAEDGDADLDADADDGEGATGPEDTDERDDERTDGDGERAGEDEDEEEETEELTEPDTASLTLMVVGPAGERIEGADVRGVGEQHEAEIPLEFSGETGTDGTYTGDIYENEYAIDIDHPAYEATTIDHTHDGEHETTVELEPDGNGTVPSTSRLTIRVVDPDGDPIEGASVSGEGEPHEAEIPLEFGGETGANGMYTDVIYENEYTLEVTHPDYERRVGTYTHDSEQDGTVELEPRDREDDDF